jgi:predicted nuclease of predicted toxin-antitoxin system
MPTAANSERVRLYVDADITPKLARALRTRGYDVVSAHEVGNAEATDREHIDFAAAQGRTLLTCNAQDFTPIFEDYWFAGKNHCGIVVSGQLELGEMLRRALVFLHSVTVEEMHNNWKNLAEFAGKEEHIGKKLKEAVAAFHIPPKMVHNDQGETVEVILSYDDYKTLLRFLADYVDWELLPSYLQDAVDHLLAEEARAEPGASIPLLGGGSMGSVQQNTSLNQWPRAAQIMNEAGRNLRNLLGDVVLARQDIDQEIMRLGEGNYQPGAIQPQDYCYNLINRAPYSFCYHMFEWVDQGRYKYLGPNYPYTGPIFWRPVEGERQVGEWKDGDYYLQEDPRR